jgi:hypothetical protein
VGRELCCGRLHGSCEDGFRYGFLASDVITQRREANDDTEILEKGMRNVSRHRMEELVEIFIRATALEVAFWDDWM